MLPVEKKLRMGAGVGVRVDVGAGVACGATQADRAPNIAMPPSRIAPANLTM